MFQNSGGQTVINKRLSFLSVAAISLALVLIAAIVSITGITIYGMRIVHLKTSDLGLVLKEAVQVLPEFRRVLPPALADAVDDERCPEYRNKLRFAVRLDNDRGGNHGRAIVEVENRGDRVVTLLSLRLIGLDEDGDPSFECSTWAATPIQADHEWRGPILPQETRRFTVAWWGGRRAAGITHEVTDLRVWREGASSGIKATDASAVGPSRIVTEPAKAVAESTPDAEADTDDDDDDDPDLEVDDEDNDG